jgi:hypothetical protein
MQCYSLLKQMGQHFEVVSRLFQVRNCGNEADAVLKSGRKEGLERAKLSSSV